MITQDIDKNEKEGLPALAEPLFNHYSFDAIDFEISAIMKLRVFLKELYPGKNQLEYDKMDQILKIQLICKFCFYAENLGSIAIAFNKKFNNYGEEIADTFVNFLEYEIREIIKFYDSVNELSPSEISRILGYPILEIQHPDTRKALVLSCENVKIKLKNIADLYSELRQFYNSYKHGYRILLGKEHQTNLDTFAYFFKEGSRIREKYVEVDQSLLDKVIRASIDCREILEFVFWHHKYRVEKETKEITRYDIKIRMFLKKDQKITLPENRIIIFKTRGDTEKVEKDLAKQVYLKFAEKLEKEHKNEYVVLDIDKEIVVAVGPELDEVARKAHDYYVKNESRLNYQMIGNNRFYFNTY